MYSVHNNKVIQLVYTFLILYYSLQFTVERGSLLPLALLLLMTSSVSLGNPSRRSRKVPCTPRPPYLILQVEQSKWSEYHESKMRDSRDGIPATTATPSDCPDDIPTGTGNVEESSPCPWVIRQDYNAERIPVIINHAECRCYHSYYEKRGGRVNDRNCVEIKRNITVLRQVEGSTDDTYVRWTPKTEEVSVGCTVLYS